MSDTPITDRLEPMIRTCDVQLCLAVVTPLERSHAEMVAIFKGAKFCGYDLDAGNGGECYITIPMSNLPIRQKTIGELADMVSDIIARAEALTKGTT